MMHVWMNQDDAALYMSDRSTRNDEGDDDDEYEYGDDDEGDDNLDD